MYFLLGATSFIRCCQHLTIGWDDRGARLREAKERVDDWDKSSSFVVGAFPRRSTSSLDVMNNRQLKLYLAFAVAILASVISTADVPAHDTTERSAFNPANYAGGNGLSKANAVVLKIASDSAGIASEYVWVAHAYPGSKVVQQALSTWDHGKRYDILTVQNADQSTAALWFDITVMYK